MDEKPNEIKIKHLQPGPDDYKPSWRELLFENNSRQPLRDHYHQTYEIVPGCYRIAKGARYS